MLVGDIELVTVPDALGVIAEYGEAYPDIPADDWEPYRALYPDLFAGNGWRAPAKSFLLRSAGMTVLVDSATW